MSHGIIHGVLRGIIHGINRGVTPTTDGPDGVITPQSLAEWQAAGLYVPAFYFRAQEASGNLADDVQGVETMDAAATPTYAQTITDWDSSFIEISETATEGFVTPDSASGGILFNTATQSVTFTFLFKLVALPGALRVLAMVAGADGYVSLNGSGILQLRNAGVATGAYNYDDGAVHFCRIGYDRNNEVWKCWTDQEVLTGVWAALPDGIKGMGGCGVFTPPPFLFNNIEINVGSDAEAIIALNGSDMADRGWTLAY